MVVLHELQHIINNPMLLTKIDEQQLDNWIAEYPSVALFYVEKYRRNNTPEQLAKSCFYVVDRTVLYEIDYQSAKTNITVEKTNIEQNTISSETENEELKQENNIEHKDLENTIEETEQQIEVLNIDNEQSDINISNINEQEKNGINDIAQEEIVESNTELSIADIILKEIEQMKAEREHTLPNEIIIENEIQTEIETEDFSSIEIEDTIISENQNLDILINDKTIEVEKSEPEEIKIDITLHTENLYIPNIDISEKIEVESTTNRDIRFINIDTKLDGTIEDKYTDNANKSLADQILEEIQAIKEHRNIVIDIDDNSNKVLIVDEKKSVIEQQQTEVTKNLENNTIKIIELDNHTIQEKIVEETQDKNQISNIEETHTFLEWLKIVDHNFEKNIQTTHSPKPNIPYENQFINENKEEFLQGILEGEIDSREEIDEDVNKLADESIAFKNELATETLAIIFTKQGKYDKAIEVYKKLMLKYPEKSVTFATQIEKIKNLD